MAATPRSYPDICFQGDSLKELQRGFSENSFFLEEWARLRCRRQLPTRLFASTDDALVRTRLM
jgi:hypothetical protein